MKKGSFKSIVHPSAKVTTLPPGGWQWALLLIICHLSFLLAPASAQCPLPNTAFAPGENLDYQLYFNWKFIWLKAGTANLRIDGGRYGGQDIYRAHLLTRGNKRTDRFFMMRDTITSYLTHDLVPLYYRKGALEGKRHNIDEVWYSYPDGHTHLRQRYVDYKDVEFKKELDEALDVITRYHSDISILHCVSQYPTHPGNLNLKTITYLKKHYGQYTIGFSDHTMGISAPIAAVGMGAEIIEKHITIDRMMKGTDQAGSLGPDGVNRMVRDIRYTELEMGKEDIYIDPCVAASKVKLERSIASCREIKVGETITFEDIHMLSPGDGFKWDEKDKVVGRMAKRDIKANEIIYSDDLQ